MLRRRREAEWYLMSVFPTVLIKPFMPCLRFQTNKEVWLNFYLKCGFLLKKAKAHDFPCPALPPCGCLRRTQGRCAWMCAFKEAMAAGLWKPRRRERDQSWTQCLLLPVAASLKVHPANPADSPCCPLFENTVQWRKSTLLIRRSGRGPDCYCF